MRVSKLITKPAREPLTLAEAKLHLRVDDDQTEDDALISGLIVSAREKAEGYTHRALITQTWESRFDGFASSLWLPHPPLQSVSSVKYIDSTGTEQTVAASVYDVDTYTPIGRVYLAYSQSWPTPRVEPQSVRVRYVTGYGPFASDVPEQIRDAMKLLISAWYENREPLVIGTTAQALPMPLSVESMLGPHRIAMP